jgi:multisubunit Na+/H+ antiporter MnhC subunit
MPRNDMNPSDPARNGIYRFIQGLMIADMAVGAGLVLAGLLLGPRRDLVLLGAGLGIIGGALFLFFRALARNAEVRRGPPNAPPRR